MAHSELRARNAEASYLSNQGMIQYFCVWNLFEQVREKYSKLRGEFLDVPPSRYQVCIERIEALRSVALRIKALVGHVKELQDELNAHLLLFWANQGSSEGWEALMHARRCLAEERVTLAEVIRIFDSDIPLDLSPVSKAIEPIFAREGR